MADPFVAEIRIFPFNFAPPGWAFCDGQLLPISQNTALFSLVGTYYGGDGRSTFGLPDLRGRAPMFYGQGPGLSLRDIAETSGTETATVAAAEIPAHTHTLAVSPTTANTASPAAAAPAERATLNTSAKPGTLRAMASTALATTGTSTPHNNMMPYLTLNFCIAISGVFPPRS